MYVTYICYIKNLYYRHFVVIAQNRTTKSWT